MDTYNPNKAVEPENWLALDEATRIELVHDFHIKNKQDIYGRSLEVKTS